MLSDVSSRYSCIRLNWNIYVDTLAYLFIYLFICTYCSEAALEFHADHVKLYVALSPVGPSQAYPRLTFPPVASATGSVWLSDWLNLQVHSWMDQWKRWSIHTNSVRYCCNKIIFFAHKAAVYPWPSLLFTSDSTLT